VSQLAPVRIDAEGFLRNLRREGTPGRVHHMELFVDREVEEAIDERFGVTAGLERTSPDNEPRRKVAMARFLGYDYVQVWPFAFLPSDAWTVVPDTTVGAQGRSGRAWLGRHAAPIASRDDLERYPWPGPERLDLRELEWYERNLPDDMCVIVRGASFAEYLSYLLGYEGVCFALHDDPGLVAAVRDRIFRCEAAALEVILQFGRVRVVWGDDDMGYATGTLIGPDATRTYALASHRKLAAMAHDRGRMYLLHSCGNRGEIIEDIISSGIDGVHSWEDKIESIGDAKRAYGSRIALLGGIDVDFLCRATEPAIRARVRRIVEDCQPGGGFCLGSGSSVANYVPVDNYLAMLDEGRTMGQAAG
jgi:uroporphyrinogen decarboxylase